MNVELLLLVCAALLLALAIWLRRTTGIPWAPIRYTDTRAWQPVERSLVSQRYSLVGKPDYIVETRAGLIPIEVKPSRTTRAPYESDLLQLAAYCLLVEDTTGQAPPYGLLRYADQTFRIPYTDSLRSELLALIDAMQAARTAPDVARSHNQPQRCRGCSFFDRCADRLE